MGPEIDMMRMRQAFCGKQLQHKPSILKDKSAVGGKNSKESVAVPVACNQDGGDKLPVLVLVIGKYTKPWCFRGSNMDLTPVTYK